jgi:hypothetical protein
VIIIASENGWPQREGQAGFWEDAAGSELAEPYRFWVSDGRLELAKPCCYT